MLKPKILIVTTSFIRWKGDNIPSFVYRFAQTIKEKCDVYVLAPHTKGAKTYEFIDGIKVHRFVYAPENLEKFGAGISITSTINNDRKTLFLIPSFILCATKDIVQLQRRNQFDIIHVNWMIPFGPIVGFIRLFTRFRFFITAHGSDVFPLANNHGFLSILITSLHRMFTLPHVDQLVSVSNPLKGAIHQLLPAIPESKISVIGMGIDYDRFSSINARKLLYGPARLAFVGRLAEVKGVEHLILAMDLLKERGIDFQLQIYGDGLLRKSLEEKVIELKLQAAIMFNGLVGHEVLPEKLAEADIFIGPSVTTSWGEVEGLGLVFLEAMAAGLAVIGSNVGGIPDVVINGQTGILVPEKNPSAIAAAIELLIADDKLRNKLVIGGKMLAKAYDWPSIADRYLQIYEVNGLFKNEKEIL